MPISAASYEILRDAVQVKDGFHLGRLQSWLDSIEEEVERPQPHKQQKKGHRHRRNLSVRIPVEALPSLNQGRSAGSLSSPEPRSYISAQLETPINGDNNGPLTSPMIRIHLTPATPASEPDHDEYFDALEWISAGHDTISAAESPSAETIRLQNQRSFNDNQGRSAAFFYCTATSSRHYQDHEDSAEPEPVQAWVFDRPIKTWVRPALLVHDQDSNTDDACSDDSESLVLGSKDEQASADVLEQRVQTSLKETRLRQLGVNELLDTDNKESTAMLEQQACELEMFLKEDWLEQRQISDLIESIDREVEADALLEQSLFDDLDASYRWRAKSRRRIRAGSGMAVPSRSGDEPYRIRVSEVCVEIDAKLGTHDEKVKAWETELELDDHDCFGESGEGKIWARKAWQGNGTEALYECHAEINVEYSKTTRRKGHGPGEE